MMMMMMSFLLLEISALKIRDCIISEALILFPSHTSGKCYFIVVCVRKVYLILFMRYVKSFICAVFSFMSPLSETSLVILLYNINFLSFSLNTVIEKLGLPYIQSCLIFWLIWYIRESQVSTKEVRSSVLTH
jgi:hypothetical protein